MRYVYVLGFNRGRLAVSDDGLNGHGVVAVANALLGLLAAVVHGLDLSGDGLSGGGLSGIAAGLQKPDRRGIKWFKVSTPAAEL